MGRNKIASRSQTIIVKIRPSNGRKVIIEGGTARAENTR